MSTASRNCGIAGGTCGEQRNALFSPGVRAKPRGYYDPRAFRQLGSGNAWPKCWPQDDNAAPPSTGLRQLESQKRGPALPCQPRMSLAFPPFFQLNPREPRLRHSPPPAQHPSPRLRPRAPP